MANLKISELTDGSTAAGDDRIAVARSPGGSTTSRYITPAYIWTYGIALNSTVSGDWTFSSALLMQGSGNAADAASALGHGGGDGTFHVHTATAGAVTAATDYDDLVVENSGNAGISVLAPATAFSSIVFGDPDDNDIGYVKYGHDSGGTPDTMYLGVNASDRITIRSDGDVGIGTTAPDGKLHLFLTDCTTTAVAGGDDLIIENDTACGMTLLSHADQVCSIYFGDENDADVGSLKYAHSNNSFAINTNTSTKFVVDDTGLMLGRNALSQGVLNVGPTSSGATSTAELLVETSGNTNVAIAGGTASNCVLNFGDSGDASAGYILYNNNTNHMVFKANGGEKLQILDSGHVCCDPGGSFALASQTYHSWTDNDNSSGAINTVLVNGGSATDNTSSFLLSCSTGAADRMYVYGNGNIVNTNNSYGALSDKKLKKNIKYTRDQWDDIKKLKLAKYIMKDDPSQREQIGLIAQDVEKVSPGLVLESPRPGHGDIVKTINYSVLWLKALGALQEAMERIEELEKRV